MLWVLGLGLSIKQRGRDVDHVPDDRLTETPTHRSPCRSCH
jgi:hypothetical protein